ncbi:DUF2953 domain-containing protein [Paenibacillus protaetiae]|uniref:DUF2953 domain-containing protein n=1 Tax=Paenibacillus protaetiae TaxID=2509456 RepID=A0A4P6ETH8_9BACL|nr:DUF2953 domain-containing protein [Paenibacillus protaetiae]QAY66204.1 DUF2953 domain-containing protein [Paenibacillus protaetiae]
MLILIVMLSPIVIEGYLNRQDFADEWIFKVRALYGIVNYRKRIPFLDFNGRVLQLQQQSAFDITAAHMDGETDTEIDKDKVMTAIDRMQRIVHLFRNLERWMRKALARVKLVEWNWKTDVGTGDAMWTAMATGAVWSVKTALLGLLSQLVRLKAEPVMVVQPIYTQQPCLRTEWTCKATLSLWDGFVITMQLLGRLRKTKTTFKEIQRLLRLSPT